MTTSVSKKRTGVILTVGCLAAMGLVFHPSVPDGTDGRTIRAYEIQWNPLEHKGRIWFDVDDDPELDNQIIFSSAEELLLIETILREYPATLTEGGGTLSTGRASKR